MDMKTLAMCTSTEPNTCFDTSKNQILTGLCGRSLQRLYTNDRSARPPRAAWTMRAKEPSRLHSPLPPPSFVAAVAVAAAADVTAVATTSAMVSAAGFVRGIMVDVAAAARAAARVDVGSASWAPVAIA